MGKEYSPVLHNRPVGMFFAGQRQNSVCKQLGVSRTQLYQWLQRAKAGDDLVSGQ